MNPRRPADKYLLQGSGFHECFGLHLTEQAIPAMLRSIFKLKNLRRAAGAQGRLAGFYQPTNGTEVPVYIDAAGNTTFWPGSLVLVVSSFDLILGSTLR